MSDDVLDVSFRIRNEKIQSTRLANTIDTKIRKKDLKIGSLIKSFKIELLLIFENKTFINSFVHKIIKFYIYNIYNFYFYASARFLYANRN